MGGQVVLVLGAGSSKELPTDLPLAAECSEVAHRQLVVEHVLSDGECEQPGNLSRLADIIFEKFGSHRELARRLPIERMQSATPNGGHLLAAALLREGKIKAVITVNFDLSMNHALSEVNSKVEVATIFDSHHFDRLGTFNLIYLHGNVYLDLDELILRTVQLTENWKGNWRQAIANAGLTAPCVVFVGLGSEAPVLTATMHFLRTALPEGIHVVQVDTAPETENDFAEVLSPEFYVQMGWCDFMRALGNRVAEDQKDRLLAACTELATHGLGGEDATSLCDRFSENGLVYMGRLRAQWLLTGEQYHVDSDLSRELLTDLILAIRLAERHLGSRVVFESDGVIEFRDKDRIIGAAVVASGRGTNGWAAIEARLRYLPDFVARDPAPRLIIANAVAGRPEEEMVADIVGGEDSDNIVSGASSWQMVRVDELREDPTLITRAFFLGEHHGES